MKYIVNALFIIGFACIVIGACTINSNVMFAVNVMTGAFIAGFVGWLLDEFFCWEEDEDDDFEEYLRHLPKEL